MGISCHEWKLILNTELISIYSHQIVYSHFLILLLFVKLYGKFVVAEPQFIHTIHYLYSADLKAVTACSDREGKSVACSHFELFQWFKALEDCSWTLYDCLTGAYRTLFTWCSTCWVPLCTPIWERRPACLIEAICLNTCRVLIYRFLHSSLFTFQLSGRNGCRWKAALLILLSFSMLFGEWSLEKATLFQDVW